MSRWRWQPLPGWLRCSHCCWVGHPASAATTLGNEISTVHAGRRRHTPPGHGRVLVRTTGREVKGEGVTGASDGQSERITSQLCCDVVGIETAPASHVYLITTGIDMRNPVRTKNLLSRYGLFLKPSSRGPAQRRFTPRFTPGAPQRKTG